MIRKILLFFTIILITLWFVGVHIIRSKVITIANNLSSDNIKILYKDTKISGFPFNWQITFISPKIIITDQKSLHEISMDSVNCKFDYFLNNVKLNFGQLIRNKTQDNSTKYHFTSSKDIIIHMLFVESLYLSDSSLDYNKYISKIKFKLDNFTGFADDRELFTLSDSKFISKQKYSDDLSKTNIKLTGDYNYISSDRKANKTHLLVDLDYLINNNFESKEENNFDHKIEISTIRLKLDDALLDLAGMLNLSRNNSPYAEFHISMTNYENLVDILAPENFILSNSHIKQLISKASSIGSHSNHIEHSADLKIIVSNNAISVGKINLLDFISVK